MNFHITHTDTTSKARAGIIATGHGDIQTPIFMPVGTIGSVKAVHQHELSEDIKAGIILGNTYHLYLRPGMKIMKEAGGLHRFMNWEKPILTDSGGYQVFSLAHNRKINENGVIFRSHIDGSKHVFSPENVVEIQRAIGADIMMAFDECTPYPCEYSYAGKSMGLTLRWLERGVKKFEETQQEYNHSQAFFPIVQGSVYKDLRRESAEKTAVIGKHGCAIGGLSVGEPVELMYEMLEIVTDILPQDKPRYLMGVGTPANILESIALGVDMMDCVMPTRNGRNGMLFTKNGTINIKNKKWENDFSPLDPEGTSFVDMNYSKAYLHHLVKAEEILALQIASIHNLAFYLWLVKKAREHIMKGDFGAWKNKMVVNLGFRI